MQIVELVLAFAAPLGLFLDIVGVSMIIGWGVAPDLPNPDGTESLAISTGKADAAKNQAKYEKHVRLTRLAFTLILAGFVLQLVPHVASLVVWGIVDAS